LQRLGQQAGLPGFAEVWVTQPFPLPALTALAARVTSMGSTLPFQRLAMLATDSVLSPNRAR
jgi:hypothetical protein